MDRYQNKNVVWDWYPDHRIVYYRFRPGSRVDAEDAAALYAMRQQVEGLDWYILLCDSAGLKNASAGYRKVAREVFGADRGRVRFAMYNLPRLIAVMMTMFLKATRLDAKGCKDLPDALDWLGIPEWEPDPARGIDWEDGEGT